VLQPQSVHTSTSHNRSPIQIRAQSPSVDTPTTHTKHLPTAAAIRPHEYQSQPVANSDSCTITVSRHNKHTAAHGRLRLTCCSRNPSTRAPVTAGHQFRFAHNRRQSTHQPHTRNTYPLQPQSVHTRTSRNRRRIRFAQNRRQSTHQLHCGPRNTYELQPQSVHTHEHQSQPVANSDSRTITVSQHTNHTAAHATLTCCNRNPCTREPVKTAAKSDSRTITVSRHTMTTLRLTEHLQAAAHEHQSQPVTNSDSRTITVSRHTNYTVAHGTLTHYSRNPSTRAPVTTGRKFRFAQNRRQSTHQLHCGPRNT
jgi:hypothetical protein